VVTFYASEFQTVVNEPIYIGNSYFISYIYNVVNINSILVHWISVPVK